MSLNISLLILSLICVALATNPPYTHHAILTADQVIAPPSTSSAWGAAVFSFDPSSGNLDYTIVNNVSLTTIAHIHVGAAPGQNSGSPLVVIPGFEGGANATVRGTVNLSGASAQAFLAGLTYLNIHTSVYPSGEIRGQILAVGQQVTVLNGAQDGVTTNATGAVLSIYDASNNNLTTILYHNVVNATMAHIHGPAAPGVNANIVIHLADDATTAQTLPIVTSTIISSDQVSQLQAGLWYFNVHSVTYGGGEIRGQIIPFINYVAELNGAQDGQVTDAYGVGLAALYGTALSTYVYHTVNAPTMAHIHMAAVGATGNVIFPYNDPTSPIMQNFTATSAQASDLTSGNDYFNVHTTAAPGGLIRGQIYPKLVSGTSTSTSGSAGTSTTGSGSANPGTSTTGSVPGSTTSSKSSASSTFFTGGCMLAVLLSVVLSLA